MIARRALPRLAILAVLGGIVAAGAPSIGGQGTVSAGAARADDGGAPPLSPLGLPCGLTVAARSMPGAMVALDVLEPCAPDTPVLVSQGALHFSARTDGFGLLTLDVPALTTPASFTIRLGDAHGQTASTRVILTDLGAHDRHAITWTDDLGLHLHAMPLGGAFGGPGHVWQQAPGRIEDVISGNGGFLSILGVSDVPEPRLAQVLTVPRTMRDALRLWVEVPVTAGTCGRSVTVLALQTTGTESRDPASQLRSRRVTLTLPGCDAVGEFVALPALFPPLSSDED